MDRLKICNPDLLDEPTRREFDRIRTCVDKCHKLAPKPLGHKLHITCSRWTRTITSRTEIWYATITPWSSISSPQKESNLHQQSQNLLCSRYTMGHHQWNLVESNHVLRIFSPPHTPSLPKFPMSLPQMDSNHHFQIQNLTC